MRHVTSLFDLTSAEIEAVLDLSSRIKADFRAGERKPLLPNRVLGLLFEKPSLRTRVSFETGISHLGGSSLFLGEDVGWGKRESMQDFAEVLSRFVDCIVCRAKAHATVEALARYSRCPVINGLTELYHPCQALADVLTVQEHAGTLAGHTIAYVGDANNVARSLAIACGKLGVPIRVGCPANYQFDKPFLDKLAAEVPNLQLTVCEDPREAVRGAVAVYTDVWASMGQESEQAIRAQAFADYQVTQKLMDAAEDDAIFLHCLPAHRGQEVAAEVIDGPQSRVYEQAENRMHAQKGLMAWLMGASESGLLSL